VLGLEPGAGLKAVRDAYRRLVRLYHPDTAGTDTASLRAFHRVTEAYRAIIDASEGVSNGAASLRPPSRDEIAGVRRMTLSTCVLNRLALSHIDEGRYTDAARILDKLTRIRHTTPRRGRRRPPARADFRINPTVTRNAAVPLPETYVNRAYLSFLFDRADQAIEHLLSARTLDEDDLSIAHNLSLMYRKRGRFLDAARITDEMAWGWEERLSFLRELEGLVSFLDRKKDVVGHLKRVVAGRHRRVADGREDAYIIGLLTDNSPVMDREPL